MLYRETFNILRKNERQKKPNLATSIVNKYHSPPTEKNDKDRFDG